MVMELFSDLFDGPAGEPGLLKDSRRFESIRAMMSHWLNTQNFIKRKKRKGNKIIGLCLPPCDLIYAFPNLVAILPLRLHLGNYNGLIRATEYLNDAILESEKYGCEPDQCVQVKTIYGSILLTKDFYDFWIGPQTCDKMTKVWELINEILTVQLVDAPHKTFPHDLEKMRNEFDLLYDQLAALAGFQPSDDDLRDVAIMSNDFRAKWREIFELMKGNIIPIHASTIINNLNYGVFDWFSKPKFFKWLLDKLYEELVDTIERGESICSGDAPRILIAGNGTMEPQLPDIVEYLGGIVVAVTMRHGWVYPQVDLNPRGDIRDNMARHQLEIYHTWRTMPRLRFAKQLIKDYKIDGVIYNSTWGCRRFSPASRLYKDELQQSLGVPVLLNDFYTFGEHLNQLKTRVGAFIELLREKRS